MYLDKCTTCEVKVQHWSGQCRSCRTKAKCFKCGRKFNMRVKSENVCSQCVSLDRNQNKAIAGCL